MMPPPPSAPTSSSHVLAGSTRSGCFTFGKVDLTPTIEDYRALIHCPRIYEERVYIKSPNTSPFKKKVLLLTGMSEEWATRHIKKKGDSECITWTDLKEILGHVDISTVDLFERLNKNTDSVAAILAETLCFLNSCRCEGEGHFIGCAPLLLVWILNHFKHEERAHGQVFLEGFSPLQDFLSRKWPRGYDEEKWMNIFRNLKDIDVSWCASWNTSSNIAYKCGEHDWDPLPGIWGSVGYAPLMVSRQYGSMYFIPVTSGLSESEFAFRSDQYKEKIRKVVDAWKWLHRVNLFTCSQKLSPEYEQWRIN
ncbi:uncharacterized protein LOC120195667 [Hibiscus syriacus]|uniref:uncharacterized protein LOC120195667 n=1 Tax=Hibiscus syriacus TaxID=106335 RepID=UPI0019237A97|nr:uncharacterized protein LOC120195667 [Hibiscus syriacus]